MSESEARVQSASEAISPTALVQDIYAGVKSPEDQKKITDMKDFYEKNDGVVVGEIEQLRTEVGSIEGWKQTKEKAKQELESDPPDVLERILKQFAPFIKNLPAGHSRGHFLRDTALPSPWFTIGQKETRKLYKTSPPYRDWETDRKSVV